MSKQRIAVIGAGISGLTIAQLLNNSFDVKLFEKDGRPGGLIKCKRVEDNLYHMVGGHVFNSKRRDVLEYFWGLFNRDTDFVKAVRNAVIFLDKPVGYPIENHLHELDPQQVRSVLSDMVKIAKDGNSKPENFESFLRSRFGETLYKLYFKPYNEKIWKRDLSKVPLSWLEGKLPMPSVEEILFNNIKKEKEMAMVHSTFYYPKNNGSQFIVDRLSEGLNITCNTTIVDLIHSADDSKWKIDDEFFDLVIFAGNIKGLPDLLEPSIGVESFRSKINNLEYHGTTSVLCEVEANPYSWVYLPDPSIKSHRIINTGNFSSTNNAKGLKTATIEFTDYVEKDVIIENLSRMPFSPKYIDHKYTKYTYPIQDTKTRPMISKMKKLLEPRGFYLLGRFAEWEYYNMDAAIGAAIDLFQRIENI